MAGIRQSLRRLYLIQRFGFLGGFAVLLLCSIQKRYADPGDHSRTGVDAVAGQSPVVLWGRKSGESTWAGTVALVSLFSGKLFAGRKKTAIIILSSFVICCWAVVLKCVFVYII